MLPISVRCRTNVNEEIRVEFDYSRCVCNADALSILEGIEEGFGFDDLVDNIESLGQMYNEIVSMVEQSVNQKIRNQYIPISTNIVDTLDLEIEFTDELRERSEDG